MFINVVTRVSNMRYFKVEKIALEHAHEERVINKTMYEVVCCGMDVGVVDPELLDLQQRQQTRLQILLVLCFVAKTHNMIQFVAIVAGYDVLDENELHQLS